MIMKRIREQSIDYIIKGVSEALIALAAILSPLIAPFFSSTQLAGDYPIIIFCFSCLIAGSLASLAIVSPSVHVWCVHGIQTGELGTDLQTNMRRRFWKATGAGAIVFALVWMAVLMLYYAEGY